MEEAAAEAPVEARVEDHVRFEGVDMKFGKRTVIRRLSCGFPAGKISVIVGGSGTGKSTMLRLIGGLIEPHRGRIIVDGENVVGMSARQLNRMRMKLGMMFQGGALLDSTNVFDNLAFPLRERGLLTTDEIRREVEDTILNVGLKPRDALRLPSELSGGMIKRVGLARAIIMKPCIVLCDEPFSGLDPITAKRIELLLMKVNRDFGMTLLVVSHDAASTMRMADHVLVMIPGRSVEGKPHDLATCDSPRVANLLSGEVDESLVYMDDGSPELAGMPRDLKSTWF